MIRQLLRLILLVVSSTASAAPAADLLSAILTELAKPAVVHAEFTQEKQLRVLSRPINSRGQVTIARGAGLIWQIESPLRMSIAIGEQQMIETDSTGKRRVLGGDGNRLQAEIGRVFRSLLTADQSVLERYFALRAEGDMQHWRIELTPASAELGKFIRMLQLTGSTHIESIRVDEPNGDTTLIRLQDSRTADRLSAAEKALLGTP